MNPLIKNIPNNIGVYLYYDKQDALIYVGKAKNLKKRVFSYFSKSKKDKKTALLVKKIADVKYVVVPTEMDALLLENNLIKKNKPKYNILLKDDKTYPWICIKKEPFPRVFQTRKIINDGSEYFGPYTSVKLVKTLLDFLNQLYPLRNCNYTLSKENIKNKKFNVCLEYHIGNCLGGCIGEQTNNDYQASIQNIRQIISGNISSVYSHLKKTMRNFSDELNYEKAQKVKEQLSLLKNYQAKSTIVNPKINNVDVFTIVSDKKFAFVNYLKIMSGAIIQAHTIELKKKLDESDEVLLRFSIIELRSRFKSTSKSIYCSHLVKTLWKDTTITIPKIGDKKKLIDLSIKNAKYLQLEKNKKLLSAKRRLKKTRVLKSLKTDLALEVLPIHIECFDNSNIQGNCPISACVVFKNGMPSKKDYRYFNIKTVAGPNDFASMEEVVYRRYARCLKDGVELPQLIIIDGGRGQLSSAIKSLEKLGIRKKIAIISIAKKLENIYLPNDRLPLHLDPRSESLNLIQKLRNEAHRFSLLNHRKKRLSMLLTSSLDSIQGIGPKTIQKLIRHFGSVKKIFSADKKDIEMLIGKKKMEKLFK